MVIIVGKSAVGVNIVILSLLYLVNETTIVNQAALYIYLVDNVIDFVTRNVFCQLCTSRSLLYAYMKVSITIIWWKRDGSTYHAVCRPKDLLRLTSTILDFDLLKGLLIRMIRCKADMVGWMPILYNTMSILFHKLKA